MIVENVCADAGSVDEFNALHGRYDGVLAGLHDFASEDDFVQNSVDLVEVEDDVKLADVAEVLVHGLNEEVDELHRSIMPYLQVRQLVVIDIHAQRKVQPCVPLVDDLEVAELP